MKGHGHHGRVAARAALLLVLLVPGSAHASDRAPASHRPLIGLAIGIRSFADDLDLGDDFCFGGRVGVTLGPRFALLGDFLASHPTRNSTGSAVHVDALRSLLRYNVVTGAFRAYAVAGVGGIFYLAHGASSWSVPAVTIGIGADYAIAPDTSAFIEFSGDRYSEQDISYDPEGQPVFTGDKQGRSLSALSAGISVTL